MAQPLENVCYRAVDVKGQGRNGMLAMEKDVIHHFFRKRDR